MTIRSVPYAQTKGFGLSGLVVEKSLLPKCAWSKYQRSVFWGPWRILRIYIPLYNGFASTLKERAWSSSRSRLSSMNVSLSGGKFPRTG